eukprot:gnl/TRDRNA2_/TRDRNA2_159715_c0_seq4.p1 gnl/TRDRNA2_/TRDRNA2_159715_c0~~gnl/TRDRNA2_/TRDRNA2_159715_c0_seq4.p1  ORF type:complete len:809 (-),score=104.11 gnl/TRDRNA2_/TRDRNA2_159715_c0_seq4:148-2523(-)
MSLAGGGEQARERAYPGALIGRTGSQVPVRSYSELAAERAESAVTESEYPEDYALAVSRKSAEATAQDSDRAMARGTGHFQHQRSASGNSTAGKKLAPTRAGQESNEPPQSASGTPMKQRSTGVFAAHEPASAPSTNGSLPYQRSTMPVRRTGQDFSSSQVLSGPGPHSRNGYDSPRCGPPTGPHAPQDSAKHRDRPYGGHRRVDSGASGRAGAACEESVASEDSVPITSSSQFQSSHRQHSNSTTASCTPSKHHTIESESTASSVPRLGSLSQSRVGTPMKRHAPATHREKSPRGLLHNSKDHPARSTSHGKEDRHQRRSLSYLPTSPQGQGAQSRAPSPRMGERTTTLKPPEPTLEQRLAMAMSASTHGMAPGVADKWKVLQLFHETLPKSSLRVSRIDRIVSPAGYTLFRKQVGDDEGEVAFYAPAGPSQLSRLREAGFCRDDFEEVPGLGYGVPIASTASIAHQRTHGPIGPVEGSPSGGQRCLCVVIIPSENDFPVMADGSDAVGKKGQAGRERSPQPREQREYCVSEPDKLLLAYLIWYQQTVAEPPPDDDEDRPQPNPAENDKKSADYRRKAARQQRELTKVRDPLMKVALQGLERSPPGTMSTVLLPSSSVEAETVVSLYLLSGGGARCQRPPGVDLREALGGVVVQRIENQRLFEKYMSLGQGDGSCSDSGFIEGGKRWREDVVWHGTRVKRWDGEGASLATKLQSIAEKGFDPQRCMKGTSADGGIWVATSPLASFGNGGDGLVAFVLCLAKTHFNEWVDSSCARVTSRDRVLPLYSLVHA